MAKIHLVLFPAAQSPASYRLYMLLHHTGGGSSTAGGLEISTSIQLIKTQTIAFMESKAPKSGGNNRSGRDIYIYIDPDERIFFWKN